MGIGEIVAIIVRHEEGEREREKRGRCIIFDVAPKSRATGNGEKIPRAPRSIPRRNVFSWFSRYTSIHMESNGTQERRQVTRDRKSISFSRSVCRRDRFESVGKVEVAEMAAMSRPGWGGRHGQVRV